MNFGAVILAGGQSRRMGTDKAFLEFGGRPLLARQIETVLMLQPDELFISGRPGADYREYDCRILNDSFPGSGPLGGIESALQTTQCAILLVLAVDMPCMSPDVLRGIAEKCSQTRGVVPVSAGRFQPLAAFYPKAAHRIALEMLDAGQLPATQFAALCHDSGLVQMQSVSQDEESCFLNWNAPDDLDNMKKTCSRSKSASTVSVKVPFNDGTSVQLKSGMK